MIHNRLLFTLMRTRHSSVIKFPIRLTGPFQAPTPCLFARTPRGRGVSMVGDGPLPGRSPPCCGKPRRIRLRRLPLWGGARTVAATLCVGLALAWLGPASAPAANDAVLERLEQMEQEIGTEAAASAVEQGSPTTAGDRALTAEPDLTGLAGPAEDVPAVEEEAPIRENDSVEVVVFEDPSFNGIYRVRPGGYITIPQVGNFKIGNMTPSEAQAALTARLEEDKLHKATVSLVATTRPQSAGGSVYVIGEVKKPGVVRIPANETLTMLTAIIRAGGMTEHADTTRVQLARLKGGRREIFDMNYDATLFGMEVNTELPLQDGDIVNVLGRVGMDLQKDPPPSRGWIYLIGQVQKPGRYEIKDMTAYETLINNGGFDRFANLKKVYILRREHGKFIKIPVNIKEIMRGKIELDVPIKNGDKIIVPEKFFSW